MPNDAKLGLLMNHHRHRIYLHLEEIHAHALQYKLYAIGDLDLTLLHSVLDHDSHVEQVMVYVFSSNVVIHLKGDLSVR